MRRTISALLALTLISSDALACATCDKAVAVSATPADVAAALPAGPTRTLSKPQQWNVADTGQPAIETEFTVTEGTWMSLDVSPDGKSIVFDLLGDLYRMPAEGGEAKLIQGGPAMQRSPRFSPDGSKLLFISDAGGSDNVWVAGADGSNAQPVTHETVDQLTGAAWGHDGTYVAAARMEATVAKLHGSDIRFYDLRGGEGRLVVDTPKTGENVHEPVLSRDGSALFYTEKVTPRGRSVVHVDANHIQYAIKRRDLATGATEQLLGGFGGATTPTLSRDGRQLAFVRRVKDKTVLFVHDLAGGTQRPVFDALERDDQNDFIGQGNYYPSFAWFPDNRTIAIWGKGKLYRVDTVAGTAREIPFRAVARQQITQPTRFSHDLAPDFLQVRAVRHVAPSPNGKSLVFSAVGKLWRQELPAGTPVRISNGSAVEAEPAFSPDGSRLAWVTWDDEHGAALVLAARDGSNPRVLVSSRGPLREPSFSADGKRLVYKIDTGDRCIGGMLARPGLYVVPVEGGDSRYVTAPGDAPRFSPDGTRIYFTRSVYRGDDTLTVLSSVTLDGVDERTHATTPDADTSELRLSPDLRWIAFRDRHEYYVAPYQEIGSTLTVSAAMNDVPVTRLTRQGGYGLAWLPDSSAAYWTLGASLHRRAVAEMKPGGAPPRAVAEIDLKLPADKPAGAVALVGARVITMRGDEVIENGTVLVQDNCIVAVGPAEQVQVPADALKLDVAGKTIMPGMVDMHGHIDNCYYTSSGITPQKQASRYADLAYGVTTNYDPYTSELPTYAQAEMTLAGLMVGPRSINSGNVAYGRSGKSDGVYTPIASLQDARDFMARKNALGGWTVKSYRQPMRQQRQMLVKAGREAGVMVDVEGESHFYDNLTMLFDGHVNLQHNMPIANYYDDVVQLFGRAKLANTPTLVVLFGEIMGENYMYQTTRSWEDPKAARYVQSTTSGYSPVPTPYGAPPYIRNMAGVNVADELWDIGFRAVARSMKKLDDAGAVISAGSHGQVAGLAMHWEMWLLAQGGMSNHRVLRTATLNGAKVLGLDKQVGSIEPGKLADLIVLDRNPLDDIHNTNSGRYTMVNGRLYDALSMDEIGRYARPRGKFYWEQQDYRAIPWNNAWAQP